MITDEIADRAHRAYTQLTGDEGSILWRKVGRHSHAETFCVQGGTKDDKKMVIQIFVDPSDKLRVDERYEVLTRISQVHDQNDLCRFVEPIACLPEYGAVVTKFIEGEDFWPTMRRQCRRLSWIGIKNLLQHVRDLAIWTVRLDQQTRREIKCENIIQASVEITTHKLDAIKRAGILSGDQAATCEKGMGNLAEELSGKSLYAILCHGDLCPANVLISDSLVTVVDIHRIHWGLPFEDAAYFLSTFDILLMETFRYNPGKVERMKAVFWDTYRSFLNPCDILYNFQSLTTQIQILNYYTSGLTRSSGVKGLVNRWRIKNLCRRLLEMIRGVERGGACSHG